MNWSDIIAAEKDKPYFPGLAAKVEEEYSSGDVFPPREKIYNAFELTPFDDVKVVILGQDPYHDIGQAMGLSFSVPGGFKIPPSLRNIYKELHAETGFVIPDHGDLTAWAKQGVLLLNTVLTVRAHTPASHSKIGWETFTDNVIESLNMKTDPVVFMLWGKPAGAKKKLISNPRHLILEAAHPSPLSASRGFMGCGHFVKCNEFLKANGLEPIDWQL